MYNTPSRLEPYIVDSFRTLRQARASLRYSYLMLRHYRGQIVELENDRITNANTGEAEWIEKV